MYVELNCVIVVKSDWDCMSVLETNVNPQKKYLEDFTTFYFIKGWSLLHMLTNL